MKFILMIADEIGFWSDRSDAPVQTHPVFFTPVSNFACASKLCQLLRNLYLEHIDCLKVSLQNLANRSRHIIAESVTLATFVFN